MVGESAGVVCRKFACVYICVTREDDIPKKMFLSMLISTRETATVTAQTPVNKTWRLGVTVCQSDGQLLCDTDENSGAVAKVLRSKELTNTALSFATVDLRVKNVEVTLAMARQRRTSERDTRHCASPPRHGQ